MSFHRRYMQQIPGKTCVCVVCRTVCVILYSFSFTKTCIYFRKPNSFYCQNKIYYQYHLLYYLLRFSIFTTQNYNASKINQSKIYADFMKLIILVISPVLSNLLIQYATKRRLVHYLVSSLTLYYLFYFFQYIALLDKYNESLTLQLSVHQTAVQISSFSLT